MRRLEALEQRRIRKKKMLSIRLRLLMRRLERARGGELQEQEAPPPPTAPPAFEPWTRHPLALLGDWRQYRPAAGEVRLLDTAAPFSRHEHLAYTADADAEGSLNVGWHAHCHIFVLDASTRAHLAPLARLALEMARRREGALHVSNRGGYHSGLDFLGEASEEARCVRAAIASAVAAAEEAEERETPSVRTPRHSWVNVSRDGHYHGLHDHEEEEWSGVLYLQVPPSVAGSSGALALRVASSPSDAADSWCAFSALTPLVGTIVLFPGWLPHCVLPLSSTTPGDVRISLAFNVGA